MKGNFKTTTRERRQNALRGAQLRAERLAEPDASKVGRVLTKSPHEIAYLVAYKRIEYGEILKGIPVMEDMMKSAIFKAVRLAIVEASNTEASRVPTEGSNAAAQATSQAMPIKHIAGT